MPNTAWRKIDLTDGAVDDDAGADFFSALNNAVKESGVTGPEEGQLCVDVAQTADELIVVAALSGTPPDKLDLHLHNDLLTIRGERVSPVPEGAEHFHRETFWGKFSRSIVLPVDVKHEFTNAEYKNGILTVRLPKVQTGKSIPIVLVDE